MEKQLVVFCSLLKHSYIEPRLLYWLLGAFRSWSGFNLPLQQQNLYNWTARNPGLWEVQLSDFHFYLFFKRSHSCAPAPHLPHHQLLVIASN